MAGRPKIFYTKPKTITFNLEESLLKQSRAVAGLLGISKSEFIRLAIKEAIERYKVSHV